MQLKSPQFLLLTFFFLVNSFWVNFYIGTFDAQIRDGSPLTVAQEHDYARLFTLVITFGVVGIPVVGACMDHMGFPATSAILISCGVIWAMLSITRSPNTLLLSFLFYSAFRTFFFTFTFAYLADVLGFKYFGVLAGIMFVLGGVLGILQYPLAEFAVRVCTSNPLTQHLSCTEGYWSQVNLVMTVCIASTLFFSYADWQRRNDPRSAFVERAPSTSSETVSLLRRPAPPTNSNSSNYGTTV